MSTSAIAQESFQFQLTFALLICSLCAVMGFEVRRTCPKIGATKRGCASTPYLLEK
jgi:hypothetical protein